MNKIELIRNIRENMRKELVKGEVDEKRFPIEKCELYKKPLADIKKRYAEWITI